MQISPIVPSHGSSNADVASLDVPSPINLQSQQDAVAWEQKAMAVRPWRTQFFECFASQIAKTSGPCRVLECDHFVGEGGMTNNELYLTVDEHRDALQAAGYGTIEEVMRLNGMVMFAAA